MLFYLIFHRIALLAFLSILELYYGKQINLFFLMTVVHFIPWVPFRSLTNSNETRNSIPVGLLELFHILSTYSLNVSIARNYHQKQQYQLSLVVSIVINKVACHVVDHIIIYKDGHQVFSFYRSDIQITLFYNYSNIGLLSFGETGS